MKAGVWALAAAIASGVSASQGGHAARRHAHDAFHKMERNLLVTTGTGGPEPTCGCTTIYTVVTGEGTLYFPPAPPTPSAMPPPPASTPAPAPSPSTSCAPAPTPFQTTCPTPGVYTVPATTLTLTEEVTVCAPASTTIGVGTYTAGGVTTVVTEATTVVCPYAAVSTAGGVVTSIIETTTYVCPSAGTYTIAPLTTVCETETVWIYPTPTVYAVGTYTQVEVVTTVTETDYVIFCPYTTETPAPPAPAPPAPAVSKAAAPAPVPQVSTSTPSLGSSGNKWAMTYSPYDSNGNCKGASDVMTDITLLASKGFTSVRIYSTDCSSLPNVGAACQANGLKLILGIFITDTGCSGAQEQVTEIISWGQWSLVELIVIGNEAVFNGFASAGELASFISSCKSSFASAGYSGPCTTTEPLNIWQANTDVFCEVVDIVGCNIHPFFNPSVDASSAGSFASSQLEIVDSLCSGKSGINLETGWPSGGSCNGAACPSPENQATAVLSIVEAVGGKSVMFSFENDLWKAAGDFDCEQSWGCVSVF